jgi:hypothetical protein
MATVKISALTPLGAMTDASILPVTSSGTTYSVSGTVLTSYLLNSISVTTASASGAGSISFNSGDGVITYTPAVAYSLPAATTSALGGVIVPVTSTSGLTNSSGTIGLATATTTQLGGIKVDGTTITINGSGVISGYAGYTLPTASNSTLGGIKVDGTTITINGSGVISGYAGYTLPQATNSVLGGVKVDNTTISASSGIISLTNSSFTINGTTVSLGGTGTVTANAATLTGTTLASGVTASSLTSVGTLTGLTVNGALIVKDVRDTVYDLGTTGGTITPDAANGDVQTITLNGALTLNAFNNPQNGQTITFIINQGTGGFALTSGFKFAGGYKTLSTAASAIDILHVSYFGSTYYASLVTGYV